MHFCVMPRMSLACSAEYTQSTSQRQRPSFNGRDQATTIGALPLALKKAGAAETGTGRPKNRTQMPPSFGLTT
jgi:hypothetical protein